MFSDSSRRYATDAEVLLEYGSRFQNSVEERMLERAAQKLRLDQLVIQQGRTQITKGAPYGPFVSLMLKQCTAANKEELLDMIHHGAEMIVSSTEE